MSNPDRCRDIFANQRPIFAYGQPLLYRRLENRAGIDLTDIKPAK